MTPASSASTTRSARSSRRSRRSCARSKKPTRCATRIVVAAARRRSGADALHQPVLGHRDGRVLPRQRQARAAASTTTSRSTRSLVSRNFAAAPPSAGPRGVSRRRLLSALAPAGARGEVERREGRRFADVAADHRNAGGRLVGVHSDQRHLDHRRPDLPRRRPVQPGRASRPSTSATRCRASAARRRSRRCARWQARCASTSRSIASWRRSRSSAATSTRRRSAAQSRRAPRRAAEAAAVLAARRRAAGRVSLYAGINGFFDTFRSRTCARATNANCIALHVHAHPGVAVTTIKDQEARSTTPEGAARRGRSRNSRRRFASP